MNGKSEENYASVNGLEMYYEVHGEGEPLILLHGGVALQAAIRHPEAVRKAVLVSTPFERGGWYPEVLAGMEQMGPEAAGPMKATPMYLLYAGVAPRPEDWPVLLGKLGDLLRQDYDWSEEVAARPP